MSLPHGYPQLKYRVSVHFQARLYQLLAPKYVFDRRFSPLQGRLSSNNILIINKILIRRTVGKSI